MTEIKNLAQANAALQPYVPLAASLPGDQMVLDRVWPLMELLGNPQDKLKIIHIAGTSGKTSTAYYLTALLAASGHSAGLTISPHVDSVAERVQIDGKPLNEAEFCAELQEFLTIIENAGQKPTYFELLYAFAMWIFAKREVDYAVVETGMGGLYDATNAARRPDKICIITDIGLDHTAVLGKTLPEITAQKAGIIHPGNQVFMYEQTPEIMAVIRKQAPDVQICPPPPASNSDLPDYQWRNWWLAYRTYQYIAGRDRLGELDEAALAKTRQTSIPARMEIREVNGKTLILDGAHNAQKMEAFLQSFRHRYPQARPAVLLALKAGKEYKELVPLLKPSAARVITTVFHATQDLPIHSMDPVVLAEAFSKAGVPAKAISDQQAAVQALLDSPEDTLIITGSFYLISQIRSNGYLG